MGCKEVQRWEIVMDVTIYWKSDGSVVMCRVINVFSDV